MIPSPYDVAIIGAGVVGCAMARRFTLEGAKVLVIEKAADPLDGASKGNSGLLHTGYDAPPGSVEWACMRAGYEEYMSIKDRLGLVTLDRGAVVAAFDQTQIAELIGMRERAILNKVSGVRLLSHTELLQYEPHLSTSVLGGLFVPGECVIDPWAAPIAYLTQAVENGAEIRLGEEVQGGRQDGSVWTLTLSSGEIQARTVVNCAGIFGDVVDQRLLGKARFRIRPRKGQFVVFDKPAAALVRSIILPVPLEHTKGVLITRTVFGNVLVGPTAEEQEDRQRASADENTARELVAKAIAIVPGLAGVDTIASYAGLRPATDEPGYFLDFVPQRRWITVAGIRSTGLTSALGLAAYVFRRYTEKFSVEHHALRNVRWPVSSILTTDRTQGLGNSEPDEIVCRCEMVTKGEVDAAFGGFPPARTLGALKRRTRVALGRCQGEQCLGRIREIAGPRLQPFEARPSIPFGISSKVLAEGKK